MFGKKKPLFGVGDLVIYNPTKKFGNEHDRLLHIRYMRYGRCTGIFEKQYWYSGVILGIGEYKSKGVPLIPIFFTGLSNASEKSLKKLEDLKISS